MEVERKTSEERADALEEAMMKDLDKPGVRRGTGLLFGGLTPGGVPLALGARRGDAFGAARWDRRSRSATYRASAKATCPSRTSRRRTKRRASTSGTWRRV